MFDDLGPYPEVPDHLVILQNMSDAAPIGLRWLVEPVPQDLPTATSSPAAGLSLSVRADGLVHVRGRAVPAEMLHRVHQEAVILHHLLNGRIVLHGSAVVIDGTAVATIGPSGAGKSTTAAALVDRGAALLADDVVAIEDTDGRLTVLATEAHVRLKDQGASATGRKDLAAPPGGSLTHSGLVPHAAQAALCLVLVLTCDQSATWPQWSQLHGLASLDALREFGAGPKGLDVLGPARLLQGMARIADQVQVWQLRRSTTGPTPDALAREVERLVRDVSSP
jgi:hypothetical protein